MSGPNLTWYVAYDIDNELTGRWTVSAPVGTSEDAILADALSAGCMNPRIVTKEWEHRAWPGGYPIYYVVADGGLLCSKCANDNIKLTSDPDAESDWRIVASDINYEDPDLFCDHCDQRIESAYGDNNEQDKDPT